MQTTEQTTFFLESWLLEPKTAAWTPGSPMPRPRAGHVAAQAPDGWVLLVGGVGA
ncbi:hypothetical protein L6R49_15065 [Myxococcota bacterium]|nr:hypothetical protein [Myxococcota bacterium]